MTHEEQCPDCYSPVYFRWGKKIDGSSGYALVKRECFPTPAGTDECEKSDVDLEDWFDSEAEARWERSQNSYHESAREQYEKAYEEKRRLG